MTAFARGSRETPQGSLTIELRSVNHRYLDLGFKLPDELRSLENPIRDKVGKKCKRGRVDILLRYRKESTPDEAALSSSALETLKELENRVNQQFPGAIGLNAADVLRWPGVVAEREIDLEQLSTEVLGLLESTLKELSGVRQREGERLAAMISERLTAMREQVEKIINDLPEITRSVRDRLEERVAEFQDTLEPGRLEQEMVLLLNRSDVSEELDRLTVHIDETERLLKSRDPVGRRLDFLMQELNREANTLGSKSNHLTMTNTAIELKVLIEQMREQVQNIE